MGQGFGQSGRQNHQICRHTSRRYFQAAGERCCVRTGPSKYPLKTCPPQRCSVGKLASIARQEPRWDHTVAAPFGVGWGGSTSSYRPVHCAGHFSNFTCSTCRHRHSWCRARGTRCTRSTSTVADAWSGYAPSGRISTRCCCCDTLARCSSNSPTRQQSSVASAVAGSWCSWSDTPPHILAGISSRTTIGGDISSTCLGCCCTTARRCHDDRLDHACSTPWCHQTSGWDNPNCLCNTSSCKAAG
mmetsp:Transcript_67852/g.141831  ORF Transcript_67852/g.141831 Transcript_67852/m.141831 type:complete len:244 (+) Transcript_67852:272-1003(+)